MEFIYVIFVSWNLNLIRGILTEVGECFAQKFVVQDTSPIYQNFQKKKGWR